MGSDERRSRIPYSKLTTAGILFICLGFIVALVSKDYGFAAVVAAGAASTLGMALLLGFAHGDPNVPPNDRTGEAIYFVLLVIGAMVAVLSGLGTVLHFLGWYP